MSPHHSMRASSRAVTSEWQFSQFTSRKQTSHTQIQQNKKSQKQKQRRSQLCLACALLLSNCLITHIDTEIAGGGRDHMNLENSKNDNFAPYFGQSVQRQSTGHHVRKELRFIQEPVRHNGQRHVHGVGLVRRYLARPD